MTRRNIAPVTSLLVISRNILVSSLRACEALYNVLYIISDCVCVCDVFAGIRATGAGLQSRLQPLDLGEVSGTVAAGREGTGTDRNV